MKFIADLHIHSHFSRATSKQLNFEQLTKWAQLKGVQVVGTGDLTHPGWLQEMKENLEPAEEGLFKLKIEVTPEIQTEIPKACVDQVRFMLSGEISNIYKKNGKTRKNHNVVFLPTFEAVEKFQNSLEKIGNIRSDGRPILGLDAKELLEIVLETDPQAHLIPAHIWTPWFSLFGSMSGFDTIEECFEDLTPHIFALETGLSSDPPMNWRLSALDNYTLVSNSDAHSPQKLAREANVFNTELSYPAIFDALKTGDLKKYLGTIEFFPEEGKYHYDGHRKCGICWDPKTTLTQNYICPECGKKVTVGVMHRVEMLADREDGAKPSNAIQFRSLIPLSEVLSEILDVGANSKTVRKQYELLLSKLGSEVYILQDSPLEEVEKASNALLAEAVKRMRNGEIKVTMGFDGEYGVIKVFEEEEKKEFINQLNIFGITKKKPKQKEPKSEKPVAYKTIQEDTKSDFVSEKTGVKSSEFPGQQDLFSQKSVESVDERVSNILCGLNPEQKEAVQSKKDSLIIIAGPGTGKTRTLTHRIAYLTTQEKVAPENILAITFTNKASGEMKDRLINLLGWNVVNRITIKTFHALGAMILKENGERLGLHSKFSIISERDQKEILKELRPNRKEKEINRVLEQISYAKNKLMNPESGEIERSFHHTTEFIELYRDYQSVLENNQLVDFDDLILLPVKLFESYPEILAKYQDRFLWISVDEYQDINSAQYELLKLLTTKATNICVIGDPDQAIYGFRGAEREYFLRFRNENPKARTIYLNKNYRSSQNILNASSQVISKSSEKTDLELWTELVSNTKLQIYQAPTHKAEAEYIVHQIEGMIGGTSYFSLDSGRVDSHLESDHYSFSDFAVLYRLNGLSGFLVEAFHRSGIPYQTSGQIPFYERKEIREMLTCLEFINNPKSKFIQEKIVKYSNDLFPFLQELASSNHHSVSDLIKKIHGFVHQKNQDSLELIHKLIRMAGNWGTQLEDFLESIALQKETDEYDHKADKVTLMTIHASKGLEFPVVFIIGCEEDLIPYHKEGVKLDLEEERRLFYVGMTRAQEKLILTNAKSRFLYGQFKKNKPSPFLADIEDALKELNKMKVRPPKEKKKKSPQLKMF